MKNAEYWRRRFSLLEEAAHREAERTDELLGEAYRSAALSVQKELDAWFGRFAGANGLTLAEAKKRLSGRELEEFRWTAEQYAKAAQQANLSEEWQRKLENASARFHVSRLEAVELQIGQQVELLFGNQLDALDGLLRRVVSDGVTHGAYEIQKGLGLGWDFAALDQKRLDALLKKPWTTDGKTFRDRCWANKAGLADGIQTELVQGLLRGDAPQKTAEAIRKRFGTSRYQARRLVYTETSWFSAVSASQTYAGLGVEEVELLGTLDGRTCSVCGAMDGRVLPLSQLQPGVTAPPFHPNCRCTTCPHYADEEAAGKRAARGADGKVYEVPESMTYEEWKKTFAEGGSKAGLTQISPDSIMELTDREQWALNEYISSGSYKINAALREGSPLSDEEKELIAHLDAALNKMPTYEGTVYRSITDFGIDDMDAFWAEYIPGKTIRFPAYMSSGTQVYDDGFPIQYVIKSRRGRDIRKFNPKEYEILFPRDSEFRIVKVEEGTITMEEVG